MNKKKIFIVYLPVSLVFFMILPGAILRDMPPERFASFSHITSLGGVLNPIVSVLLFLAIVSVILAMIAVPLIGRCARAIINRRKG
ncbi:hypothetical protein [Erwinia sp. S38]|uniref:hypothetical protein n=1 Tax=Erwinia sp. S38 TaxID=2769338 RepID=UPI00190C9FA6|nr:hypothetical protein [Erwinia sp. S38]MBK0002116.1 hypothetical protein [Erwinia sp. S38]